LKESYEARGGEVRDEGPFLRVVYAGLGLLSLVTAA
jgi:hypothetical protein